MTLDWSHGSNVIDGAQYSTLTLCAISWIEQQNRYLKDVTGALEWSKSSLY